MQRVYGIFHELKASVYIEKIELNWDIPWYNI